MNNVLKGQPAYQYAAVCVESTDVLPAAVDWNCNHYVMKDNHTCLAS